MQSRRAVAQHAVGDDHQRVARAVTAGREHAAAQHDRPRMAHHAPLARELAAERGHHLLAGARRRHVHGTQAALDHVERQRQVVTHDRVHHDVGVAAGRIDGAIARRDRAQPRLERAQRELVAPVDPLLVGRMLSRHCRSEARLPARIADARVLERAHELARGVGVPERVRVREGDDLPTGSRDGGVLRADLAAARQLEHEVRSGVARALRRGVRAAVAGHYHLQALARVVERERVVHLRADDVLLVVRGHDQRQRGQHARFRLMMGSAPRGAPPACRARLFPGCRQHAGEQGERQRVAELRPRDQARADPEADLERSLHELGFSPSSER